MTSTNKAMSTNSSNKKMSRWGCVGFITLWAILAILPILGCRLISNGQLEWGESGGNQMRIFLLQEPGQEGIGLQRSRLRGADNQCLRTEVSYWMWAGEAEGGIFCQCSAEATSIPDGCNLP